MRLAQPRLKTPAVYYNNTSVFTNTSVCRRARVRCQKLVVRLIHPRVSQRARQRQRTSRPGLPARTSVSPGGISYPPTPPPDPRPPPRRTKRVKSKRVCTLPAFKSFMACVKDASRLSFSAISWGRYLSSFSMLTFEQMCQMSWQ